MLIKVEGADIKISNTFQSKAQHLHTLTDIQNGRFRRLLGHHRNVYRLFNFANAIK